MDLLIHYFYDRCWMWRHLLFIYLHAYVSTTMYKIAIFVYILVVATSIVYFFIGLSVYFSTTMYKIALLVCKVVVATSIVYLSIYLFIYLSTSIY